VTTKLEARCSKHYVVAVVEPVADQRLDQSSRVLAIAVNEQDRAKAGVIEAGEERGFLPKLCESEPTCTSTPEASVLPSFT
jgi:hypothetical protein